jgi:hypothetical protein
MKAAYFVVAFLASLTAAASDLQELKVHITRNF